MAEPKPDGLDVQAKACDANVSYFRGRIDSAVFWGNFFMIGGALVSATGAALAGLLRGDTQRRVAAVVGALGAVVTVLPKTLPDKESLQAQLANAEKHRVLGTKVRNQFQFASPTESIVEAQKYVSARFTDCAGLAPPAAVPDLPAAPMTDSLVRSVDASKPETFHAQPTTAPGVEPPVAVSAAVAPIAVPHFQAAKHRPPEPSTAKPSSTAFIPKPGKILDDGY
ncbi:MAG: hypothetical protein QM756_42905 [Polyangiaceae bacterium]